MRGSGFALKTLNQPFGRQKGAFIANKWGFLCNQAQLQSVGTFDPLPEVSDFPERLKVEGNCFPEKRKHFSNWSSVGVGGKCPARSYHERWLQPEGPTPFFKTSIVGWMLVIWVTPYPDAWYQLNYLHLNFVSILALGRTKLRQLSPVKYSIWNRKDS